MQIGLAVACLVCCFVCPGICVAEPTAASWWAKDPIYRLHRGQLLPRTSKGFNVNASYKSVAMVEALLTAYQRRNADITRLQTIGTSHGGRPILALRISETPGQDADKPAVLLTGAMHGDELLAVDYVFDALQQILEHRDDQHVQQWIKAFDIWIVPLVNPDGNHVVLEVDQGKQRGRRNGRDNNDDGLHGTPEDGVDLNRNFPYLWGYLQERGSQSDPSSDYYRGPNAGSEPETKALMTLADRYRFVAALSWHTNGRMILSPYTIEGLLNPKPDVAWQIAKLLRNATKLPNTRRGFRVKRQMYPVDGTDQDWYFHTHGTLAYIIEGSHHNPLKMAVRRRSTEALRPITGMLLDRILAGPAVYGRVTVDGQPVEAEIEIAEIEMNAGEGWKSRPFDGRFERHLPRDGTYTLIVHVPGHRVERRKFTVGRERLRVDVIL